MNKGLTKEQTKILQGLAILMMLYHHLFSTPEALGIQYLSLLKFGNINAELKMAWFFKICVAIYAFVSGYGLSRTLSSNKRIIESDSPFKRVISGYRITIKKYIFFYLQYLLVFIIFVPVGFLFFNKPFEIKEFLLNLLGISSSYNGAWWYVAEYFKMLMTLPILDIIFTVYKTKLSRISQIAFIIVLLLTGIIMYLVNPALFNSLIDFMQPAYYLCFVVGFLISRLKLYELANLLFSTKVLYFLGILGLLLVIIARVKIAKDASSAGLDFIFVPVFAFGFICLSNIFKFIAKPLVFFGECSTFMWLTHVFYYDHYAKSLVMSSHVSVFIYLTLLAMSTITAYLLNLLWKYIYGKLSVC